MLRTKSQRAETRAGEKLQGPGRAVRKRRARPCSRLPPAARPRQTHAARAAARRPASTWARLLAARAPHPGCGSRARGARLRSGGSRAPVNGAGAGVAVQNPQHSRAFLVSRSPRRAAGPPSHSPCSVIWSAPGLLGTHLPLITAPAGSALLRCWEPACGRRGGEGSTRGSWRMRARRGGGGCRHPDRRTCCRCGAGSWCSALPRAPAPSACPPSSASPQC